MAAKSCGSAESGQTALAFVLQSNEFAQELLEYPAAGSETVKCQLDSELPNLFSETLKLQAHLMFNFDFLKATPEGNS